MCLLVSIRKGYFYPLRSSCSEANVHIIKGHGKDAIRAVKQAVVGRFQQKELGTRKASTKRGRMFVDLFLGSLKHPICSRLKFFVG